MDQGRAGKSWKLPLGLALAGYLAVVVGYCLWSYSEAQEHLLSDVDHRLDVAAIGVPHILPSEYFETAAGPNAISRAEYAEATRRLTQYSARTGMKYVYACAEDDGEFRFLATNAPPQVERDGTQPRFWERYKDAPPALTQVLRSGKPLHASYTDHWGSYRSILLPFELPSGRVVVIGIDTDINELHAQMTMAAVESAIAAAVLLLATLPIVLMSIAGLRRYAAAQVATNIGLAEQLKRTEAAEAQIRDKEARLDLALSVTNTGMWDINLQTEETFYSEQWYRMLGYEPDEFPADLAVFFDLMHDADRPRAKRDWEAFLASEGSEWSNEMRLRCKDGSYRWLLTRGRTVERDEEGRILRMTGTHTDITMRRESEARLRMTQYGIDTTGTPTAWVCRDGTFLSANEASLKTSGYTWEQLSRLQVRDVAPEIAKQDWDAYWQRCKDQGTTISETTIRREDDSIIPVMITVHHCEFDGQEYHFTQWVDVTPQREATRRLEESEQRLELALEGGELGLWDWQVQTGEVIFNDLWATMLGYELDELAPRVETWSGLVHPDDFSAAWAELSSCLEGKTEQYEAEFRMRHKDGHWVWILDRGRVVERDAEGNALRAAGTHLDITDHRRSREALRAIVQGTAGATGEAFFPNLVEQLGQTLGVKLAMVAQVTDADHTKAETFAIWRDGQLAEPMDYELAGTPCADVLRTGDVTCSGGARERYPHAPALRSLDADSYMGYALYDAANQPTGFLAIIDDHPLEDPEVAASLLRVFATRASAELVRTRAEEAVRESEERFRRIWDSTPLGLLSFELDQQDELILIDANAAADAVLGKDNAANFGRRLEEVYECLKETDLAAACREVALTGNPLHETDIAYDCDDISGTFEAIAFRPSPRRVVLMFQNVTERKRAEEQRRLLMAELDHRVKNNLAAVMSLAMLTGTSVTDYEAFNRAFSGRIRSMAMAHEALAESRWKGVNLREIADRVAAPYRHDHPERFTVSGPEVTLPARAAGPLALSLHELATNAAKYGSLSDANGRVELHWELVDEQVTLTWREADGPPVSEPTSRGQGSNLIGGLIRHELAGSVDTKFHPDGLVCIMQIPLLDGAKQVY